MWTWMWPIEDFPEINILISIALNVQKYAHNQLQPGTLATLTDVKLLHASPAHIDEEDLMDVHYDTRHLQAGVPTHPIYHQGYPREADVQEEEDNEIGGDEELDVQVSIHNYPNNQRSRSSSIRSDEDHHSGISNHNSDTIVPASSTVVPSGPATGTSSVELDEFYTPDSASDTEYLRSKWWWLGMTLMILGECGNFLAYGYAQASIVAPLGTVALVSNVILAPLMLKEPFRRRDLVGIVIAIIGTVVVVINSKENEIKLTPEAVVAALLQTQFIVYFIVCCVLVAVLASLSDTIGSEYIFIDLGIVAIFGGYTVLATKGVSSLVSLSFYKMFTYPIAYLLVFVMVSTAVLQIKFLNKSLQRFDSTQVIPTQFVLFTASAIVGSGVLYNDFNEMDFNKAFNFLTGCCMTFLGVYFITSHRGIGDEPTTAAVASAHEWALASQSHFAVPIHLHPRASVDSYVTAGRSIYPIGASHSSSARPASFIESGYGRVSIPGIEGSYAIPQPASNRTSRYGAGSAADLSSGQHTDRTPLLGTSSRQSLSGPKDHISSIASSVHNALATLGSAVGTHHTALLSLESKYGNTRRNDERRGSVQSLGYTPLPLQRPPLGSRSSSACSGVFPPPSISTHPSSTSLVMPPEHSMYGTSFQSTQMPMHFARLSNAGLVLDSRYQAPHLQDRSASQDAYQRQPRKKMSTPHLNREQHKELKLQGSSLRLKTNIPASTLDGSGGVSASVTEVAVPRRKGDRQRHPLSPIEQRFATDVSRSLDSVSSSTPKAAQTTNFLPRTVLSSSPGEMDSGTIHAAQVSECVFQTIRSSTDRARNMEDSNRTAIDISPSRINDQ
ncbi:hypothetical protein EDD11_004454 [Mortierella claussenii]|nr:hypothetical protein EDD11_004454 [Mortierella claussenii]